LSIVFIRFLKYLNTRAFAFGERSAAKQQSRDAPYLFASRRVACTEGA